MSKKHQNSGSEIAKNEFGQKLIVAILSMRKPRIRMPESRNFDTEINKKTFWDQARKKMKFWASWIQKAPINRFQNHPKIDENPTPDHFVSILLLSWASKVVAEWPPGCFRGAKMVARNIKIETPRSPNGNLEGLEPTLGFPNMKWGGVTSRLPSFERTEPVWNPEHSPPLQHIIFSKWVLRREVF